MRFFTPELFVELNSDNDDVIDRAERKWEVARTQYQNYLKSIEKKLPNSLLQFCKEMHLHDSRVKYEPNPVWTICHTDNTGQHTGAVLAVTYKATEFVLSYLDLVEPTRVHRPVDSPVFHSQHVLWLYDEVSQVKKNVYSHDILFSDGNVLTVRFKGFMYDEIVAARGTAHETTVGDTRLATG
jgi:hypothetical protein